MCVFIRLHVPVLGITYRPEMIAFQGFETSLKIKTHTHNIDPHSSALLSKLST